MSEFTALVKDSIEGGRFIQLVLSSPIKTVEPSVTKLTVRQIQLGDDVYLQFTRQDGPQQFHQNLTPEMAVAELERLFGQHFRHAHLFAVDRDVSAKQKASGKLKINTMKPTKTPQSLTHNRKKQYIIPEGVPCAFLEAIGVMNAAGRVLASKYDKFKQVNRFLEFVDDIYASLPKSGVVRVVDFGCGKSYLTFAMHHLLVNVHQRQVDMLGIDLKESVIQDCEDIATRLKCEGLRFLAADINDVVPDGDVDLVVSLHACDTATDVALARAIKWRARAILSAPCCHHEFAKHMHGESLPQIHGHGILHERFAELATDAYRAQMLESYGYKTQVIEFVDLEHTARNLLIRATRSTGLSLKTEVRDAANRMATDLGVAEPTLNRLLNEA